MLLYALLLAAQTNTATPTPPNAVVEPDRVVYAKKTFIDVTEQDIVGTLVRPEYKLVKARGKTKLRNLIELRANFRPELSRSKNAIR